MAKQDTENKHVVMHLAKHVARNVASHVAKHVARNEASHVARQEKVRLETNIFLHFVTCHSPHLVDVNNLQQMQYLLLFVVKS